MFGCFVTFRVLGFCGFVVFSGLWCFSLCIFGLLRLRVVNFTWIVLICSLWFGGVLKPLFPCLWFVFGVEYLVGFVSTLV